MSILGTIKQRRELGRLRRETRQSPSPATLGALAEKYIAVGRLDDAYKTARQGQELFPTSERLASICTFARKQRHQSEIRRLRMEMADRPSPTTFSHLAEIYRDLGNLETALHICEECIQLFPLNENPYLIIGEVRLSRFFQDLIAHDGLEAEKQLRRVSKLNNQNLKAWLLLGQLYYSIGAVDALSSVLEEVRKLSPGNKEVEKFVRVITSRPPEVPPPIDSEDDDLERDLSVGELLRAVEAHACLPNEPRHFPSGRFRGTASVAPVTARLDVESLKHGLGDISSRPGIENTLILDRDGEPLADCSDPDSLTRKQFTELITEILATSEDASRRMDVGTLRWCTVEGAFGGVTITKVKNISLGVKYEQTVNPVVARKLLQEFAARNFTAPMEGTHA